MLGIWTTSPEVIIMSLEILQPFVLAFTNRILAPILHIFLTSTFTDILPGIQVNLEHHLGYLHLCAFHR